MSKTKPVKFSEDDFSYLYRLFVRESAFIGQKKLMDPKSVRGEYDDLIERSIGWFRDKQFSVDKHGELVYPLPRQLAKAGIDIMKARLYRLINQVIPEQLRRGNGTKANEKQVKELEKMINKIGKAL